ncbi:MAG: hypothetical protein AAB795_00495 [Patescibacteria group bacterium]
MKTNTQKGSVIPAVIAIVVLLILGGIYMVEKNKDTGPGEMIRNEANGLTTDLKIHTDNKNGFKFNYPNELTLTTSDEISQTTRNDIFSITHSVPFKHTDPCNMKDWTSLDNITDFHLKGEIKDGRVENIIRDANYYGVKFDPNTNKPIIEKNSGFKEFNTGNLSGYTYSMGVEGCGVDIYFLSLNGNKTLILQNYWIGEFAAVNNYKERQYDNLPGIILPQKRNIFTDKILSSFEFTN